MILFGNTKVIKILLFVFTLALSIIVFLLREQLSHIAALGYIGIFLVTFFSSASILLPLPGTILVVAGGSAFDPAIVALTASIGETIGELIGYTLGRTGRHIFLKKENSRYKKIQNLMKRFGVILIYTLAVIPNPIFDIIGITSGALKFSLSTFTLACFLGKLTKNSILTLLGSLIN